MKYFDTLVPREFRGPTFQALRRFYATTLLATFGNGLTLSMFIIYLHNVRGFSVDYATLLLSVSALVGFASTPSWGTMVDRFGPVKIALIVYVADALALAVWAFAHSKTIVTGAAVMLAIFGGAGWGPGMTLLSRLVDEERRQRAFGFNFMLVNLGIGAGALISASIVDLHRPITFTYLYLFNAIITLATAGLFVTLRHYGGPVTHEHEQHRAEGWPEVLRDYRLRRYVISAIVLMVGGYGSLEAGFSLFVVDNLHLSVHYIGVIYFFNTSTIVVAQLWIIKRIEGRSRTRVMAVVGVFWFIFWVILDVALVLPAAVAVAALCVAMAVFAIGETMLQPVGSAIVNQIAPEHLRGRYNAAAGAAWGLAGTLGPAITALYFTVHLGDWWPFATGLTALIGGAMILSLRRQLSAHEDGRGPGSVV